MWNDCAKEILYISFERLSITQTNPETSQECRAWRDASYYIMYKSIMIEEAKSQQLPSTLLRNVFIDMEYISQDQFQQLLGEMTLIISFILIKGSFTSQTENILLASFLVSHTSNCINNHSEILAIRNYPRLCCLFDVAKFS